MLTVLALISTVRNVDRPCADALYPWMCTLVFRPCILQNYSAGTPTLIFLNMESPPLACTALIITPRIVNLALPNVTCTSFCTQVNSVCAATFLAYGQPPQAWYATASLDVHRTLTTLATAIRSSRTI